MHHPDYIIQTTHLDLLNATTAPPRNTPITLHLELSTTKHNKAYDRIPRVLLASLLDDNYMHTRPTPLPAFNCINKPGAIL